MLHVMSFLFQPHSFVKMRTLNAIMDVWQIQLRVLCLDCQRHAVYKTQVGTEIVVIFVIFVLIVLNVFILFWIVCLSPILVTPMTHYPSPMTQPLAWPIEPCPAGAAFVSRSTITSKLPTIQLQFLGWWRKWEIFLCQTSLSPAHYCD